MAQYGIAVGLAAVALWGLCCGIGISQADQCRHGAYSQGVRTGGRTEALENCVFLLQLLPPNDPALPATLAVCGRLYDRLLECDTKLRTDGSGHRP